MKWREIFYLNTVNNTTTLTVGKAEMASDKIVELIDPDVDNNFYVEFSDGSCYFIPSTRIVKVIGS